MREFKRGGQVYFLHNEVDTIFVQREKLEKYVPDARIGIAHGQLRERELESVMRDLFFCIYCICYETAAAPPTISEISLVIAA